MVLRFWTVIYCQFQWWPWRVQFVILLMVYILETFSVLNDFWTCHHFSFIVFQVYAKSWCRHPPTTKTYCSVNNRRDFILDRGPRPAPPVTVNDCCFTLWFVRIYTVNWKITNIHVFAVVIHKSLKGFIQNFLRHTPIRPDTCYTWKKSLNISPGIDIA